jgi:Reverse transcriptase (RNA-dependent DNA polymerase)
VNDKAVFLSNMIAKLIQGENNPINNKNLQHDPESRALEAKNHQDDPGDFATDNAINFITDNAIDFVTDNQNQQQNPLNQMANKPETPQNPEALQSCRTRIPTRYIKDIQSGVGTADGRPGKLNLPPGIQIPNPTTQVEEETEDAGQIKHAMAAAISEIEAFDPQSLEEARQRPDWPKWQIAIQEELKVLKTAGTWKIVERPENGNIVKNKWVFKIKRNATGKIKRYKARVLLKVSRKYKAKLGLIHFLLATATQHGWPIDMFDFHSAFLNSELDSDEEVFMEQPQGYEESNQKWYFANYSSHSMD